MMSHCGLLGFERPMSERDAGWTTLTGDSVTSDAGMV
jgi:hypothetical protein